MSDHANAKDWTCTLPPGHDGPCKPGRCPWRGWWGFCGNSFTVAWGYVQLAAGFTLDVMNALVVMPEITDLVTSYGGPYAPHILKGFGLVTVVVRLRSLSKG